MQHIPFHLAFLFTYLLWFCWIGTSAVQADVTWLRRVSDCDGFETELKSFLSAVGTDRSRQTASQQLEYMQVRDEACGPRFKGCGFSICDIAVPLPAEMTPAGTSTSKIEPPVENASSDQTKSSESIKLGRAFANDPIVPWLNQNFSCDELHEQIQARYRPFGKKLADWPENKRRELYHVQDVICSDRFAHCHFPQCETVKKTGTVTPGSTTLGSAGVFETDKEPGSQPTQLPVQSLSNWERDSLKQSELLEYTKLKLERRAKMLEESLRQESERPVSWNRFEMPGEIAARPAASRIEKPRSTTSGGNRPKSGYGAANPKS